MHFRTIVSHEHHWDGANLLSNTHRVDDVHKPLICNSETACKKYIWKGSIAINKSKYSRSSLRDGNCIFRTTCCRNISIIRNKDSSINTEWTMNRCILSLMVGIDEKKDLIFFHGVSNCMNQGSMAL